MNVLLFLVKLVSVSYNMDIQIKVHINNYTTKLISSYILSRAKVTANKAATTLANEYKDANDKVMPVKQWLEEMTGL